MTFFGGSSFTYFHKREAALGAGASPPTKASTGILALEGQTLYTMFQKTKPPNFGSNVVKS